MSNPLYWLNYVWILGLLAWAPSHAQDLSFTLTIQDHRFKPSELQVPAGKRFKLLVKNLDATAEEFESHDLKLEKVIPGKSDATLTVRALKPGSYRFVGEFHEKTAQGGIIAK
jgi:plastocyanin